MLHVAQLSARHFDLNPIQKQQSLASIASVNRMSFIWRLLFGLVLWLAALMLLARCQGDLELDYSNEYDDVRPQLIYPNEPRLDQRITAAAQEFGENIRHAWQSMVDSIHNYFEELRDVFADGVDDNVDTFRDSN